MRGVSLTAPDQEVFECFDIGASTGSGVPKSAVSFDDPIPALRARGAPGAAKETASSSRYLRGHAVSRDHEFLDQLGARDSSSRTRRSARASPSNTGRASMVSKLTVPC